MRVDLTINIPTILTIVGLVSAVCSFGIGIYSDMDKRILRTDIALTQLTARVDKADTTINNLKTEQAVQMQTMRTDMKADISEIKDLLNRLIFGGSPQASLQRRQLNEWSKK